MRVAVTGGSGFIGSNIVNYLVARDVPLVNIDLLPPRNPAHKSKWARCDVLDAFQLRHILCEFAPTHVLHMAARTDLRGQSLAEYAANVAGVQEVVEAVELCKSVKRVIFASSMLVCHLGYRPKSDTDFSPDTAYGLSKATGEQLVRSSMHDDVIWTLVRPSSIWGPWFGEPYADFFKTVLSGRFVKFGPADAHKTFGYVGNLVHQIMAILAAPEALVHQKQFYLGDYPPLKIGDFADSIALLAGVRRPKSVPYRVIQAAAYVGDWLTKFGLSVPMTSFRLRNMTSNNVVDLSPIRALVHSPRYDLEAGITETLEWINKYGASWSRPR